MGGQCSKSTREAPQVLQPNSNSPYAAELGSYEAACRLDPNLQSFDSSLHARTNLVIKSLAVGGEVRSLSLDSLKEVTGCLLEMNREVVKIILECKKDIWKNPDLLKLVEEYFENSLQTLDFCTALEKCLRKARDSQLIIQVALLRYEEESKLDGKKYLKTLDELKNFKAAGDPFTTEFFEVFNLVYKKQESMLEKLHIRQRKLDKKLKSVKAYRKVSSIIFVATFASVLICSVVAAAMVAPPVVVALAAAASVPLGSLGKWLDSIWKGYENAVKGQNDVINSMWLGAGLVINDLKTIQVLVDRLEIEIESLLQNADFSLREEEAVKFGIEEIRKKLGVFMKSIDDLGEHADRCSQDINIARTVVLQRIIRHPDK
ncbi:hypothetical protein HHK36_002426 [Tetracentron sinense]|uniref:Uncharacterized protein n=1 Tax=Tetracentron sinense TaxID=13715 RepID=A0A835DRJ1_TETSI|nr:hypothetical protein HHK36_002426 [Tetracentron sinense]